MFDTEELLVLLAGYMDKHPLVAECGSEYIYEDDEAQRDAIELVANIFDSLME
jgi:hypothetical protein